MQMASMAASDPFVKIRGLIEDMIEKLLKEAQEEASQKAFCDEEMGKSKKSQAEKTATIEKLQTRIDGATATIAELTEAVKTLEAEIADIDKAQAEATKIRTKENADNTAAIKDFRQSADAVVAAMGVLKSFYEGGALIQTSSKSHTVSKATKEADAKAKASEMKSLEVSLSHHKEDHASVSSELDAVLAYIDKLKPQCEEKAMSYEERKAAR